ncbi:hypothetical protein CWATWH0003_5244b4, partial [Crocosphaera watsonii WH 0003]
QEIIKMNKRSYGNQLDKFEPRDLNNGYCPNMKQFNYINQKDVNKIIKIAKIDEKKAILMSNHLIKQIINREITK